MDLTDWLEYFTAGLAAQMREVQEKGERVIKRDVVLSNAHKAGLKNRPVELLSYLLDHGKGTVGELEGILK